MGFFGLTLSLLIWRIKCLLIKFSLNGKIIKILVTMLAFLFSINVMAENTWDGYFVGISLGNDHVSSNQSYSHIKASAVCDNNNYGSMGNGVGCGGTEDYQKNYSNSNDKFSAIFRAGRYWQQESYVIGLSAEYAKNSTFDEMNAEVITSAFGDTLSVTAKRKDNVSVFGLVGYPVNDFLPFIMAGISNAEVRASTIQDIAGYNLSRSFDESDRLWGYSLGAGLKWRFSRNLIVSGEYIYSDYESFKINATSYAPPTGGGINYPSTSIDTNVDIKTFRVGFEYQF